MLHGPAHPGVAGSELTRLLARLADAPPADSRPAFAERLGHWLSWTGALSLAAALKTSPAVDGPVPGGPATREEADVLRVCAGLDAAIAAGPRPDEWSPTDFGPYRRHCLARQSAMQEALAALRQRLRDALTARGAAGARLAALDAVLDRALAEQERGLLGLVPLRLQQHFDRLRHAAGPADTAWLPVFHDDLARVLRAELAHRLLPVRGLLDTLRPTDPT